MSSAVDFLRSLPPDIRVQRLEALVMASESLSCATGLDRILTEILDLTVAQLACDRATLFLIDPRTEKLHARLVSGGEQIEIILEAGTGIAGFVAQSGERVYLNDVQSDPRFDATSDKRTGYVTNTMICVPLRRFGGELLGALQAINARAGAFAHADLLYLESLAALAAVAVERERLTQDAVRSRLISTELELGRTVQARMLPPTGRIAVASPVTAWGRSQACYDVGGDAYNAVTLSNGDCAFWVADVSGKGIGAAMLMVTLQTELLARTRSGSNLVQLVARLSERVREVAPIGTYATLFLAILSPATATLTYVNAGQVLPVWLAHGAAANVPFISSGTPVGLLPHATYEAGQVEFPRGARLALFSDGVTDAENTTGHAFDDSGLYDVLQALDMPDVNEIGASFFAALDRFRIGAPAQDDTTLLVVGLD